MVEAQLSQYAVLATLEGANALAERGRSCVAVSAPQARVVWRYRPSGALRYGECAH